MSYESVIKQYFQDVENANFEAVMSHFEKNAVVVSPIYGEKPAIQFFTDIFEDSSTVKVVIKNIFLGKDNQNTAMAQFRFDWTMKDNQSTSFDCVDIFEFVSADSDKIKKLTIIYDSYLSRTKFNQMKKS